MSNRALFVRALFRKNVLGLPLAYICLSHSRVRMCPLEEECVLKELEWLPPVYTSANFHNLPVRMCSLGLECVLKSQNLEICWGLVCGGCPAVHITCILSHSSL